MRIELQCGAPQRTRGEPPRLRDGAGVMACAAEGPAHGIEANAPSEAALERGCCRPCRPSLARNRPAGDCALDSDASRRAPHEDL